MTNIRSFLPPKRILLGPGPSNVHARVLEAMARPTVGHLDPEFIRMMDEIKVLLQEAFQTKNEMTMVVSGPGSAGMETCFVNLIEPGEKVIVCQNGVFGGRIKENVERAGGVAVLVEDEWGRAVTPEKLEQALKKNPEATLVAFVHAETSTGALSDAKTLIQIAHSANCLAVVDAVTSLGGVPLLLDKWGADAVYSGSQKCLSCAPGLSPISFNARAMEKVRNRKSKARSWFLDLNLVTAYWNAGAGSAGSPSGGKRAYHHTAPVNALYGLHEALLMLQEEGLEKSWERHRANHLILKQELERVGLEFLVSEPERLPQLNSVRIPEGKDDARIRARLLNEFDIEIGAGLGILAGKVWRIGLMGQSSSPQNISALTAALQKVL